MQMMMRNQMIALSKLIQNKRNQMMTLSRLLQNQRNQTMTLSSNSEPEESDDKIDSSEFCVYVELEA